jgi:hypothetical protein
MSCTATPCGLFALAGASPGSTAQYFVGCMVRTGLRCSASNISPMPHVCASCMCKSLHLCRAYAILYTVIQLACASAASTA